MMAWGIHSRTSPSHHRNAPGARSAMSTDIFTFRNAVSIPWKGNAPEDHLSPGATMLMLRMIRLKMTNAAKMDMTMPYWASVQPSSWSRMSFRMERIWSYSDPAFLLLLLPSLPVSYILLIFLITFWRPVAGTPAQTEQPLCRDESETDHHHQAQHAVHHGDSPDISHP